MTPSARSIGGKWWLVTWTTYGTWLPGDPRGFQTRAGREYIPPPARYARPGEAAYVSGAYAGRYRHAQAVTAAPARMNAAECRGALDVILREIEHLPIEPCALAVGPTHVHLLARFGAVKIRPTIARLKSAATRALAGFGQGKRLWCRGCHSKSLPDEVALRRALDYVCRHVSQDAVLHVWRGGGEAGRNQSPAQGPGLG